MPVNQAALTSFRAFVPQGTELTDQERLTKPNNGICDFIFWEKSDSGMAPALRTEFNPGAQDPQPVDDYGI